MTQLDDESSTNSIQAENADGAAECPKSLTAMVTEKLLASIIDGSIPLGSLLSEKVLARELGVSKTPVREALVRLKGMGLVEILPRRGGRVFKPDAEQLRELAEARLELETIGLKLSMQRARTRLVALIESIVRDMGEVFDVADPTQYQYLDTAFHNALFTYCGNSLIHNAYDMFNARISALRTNHSTPHSFLLERSLEEHKWLLELIRRDDLKSAQILLGEHIARTRLYHQQSIAGDLE